jgi:hypothetical protein
MYYSFIETGCVSYMKHFSGLSDGAFMYYSKEIEVHGIRVLIFLS